MALINKLENLGDAVREKTGTTDLLTLDEMAEAINGLTPGPTEDDLTITGRLDYMFYNDRFLSERQKVVFPFILKDVTSTMNCFTQCSSNVDLSDITITTKDYTANDDSMYASGMFQQYKGTTLPVVNGKISILSSGMFQNASYLRDETIRAFLMNPNLELGWRSSNNQTGNPGLYSLFGSCYSLRNVSDILLYIHQWFIDHPITYTGNLTDYYASMCYNCYALDEVCNIPVFEFPNHGGNTYDAIGSMVNSCGRAKDITFCTNNGVPYVKKWKNQTMSLDNQVGYCISTNNILNYNTGITSDKCVKDDATYQALKDDPDWFTNKVAYSRYNHDSAVRTINSLPDTSAYLATAGGTNTIKFKGESGSATDGGAINTLTAEEIAVATAKGWTVTLV